MKTFNGIITSITPPQVTWSELEKPILIFSRYHPIDLEKMKEYEASKVVSEVENVEIGETEFDSDWIYDDEFTKIAELKLGMSCQVIESGDKVRITKIN